MNMHRSFPVAKGFAGSADRGRGLLAARSGSAPARPVFSVDQGIYSHLTLRNMAVLAEDRGNQSAAVECWTRVLAECPGDAEASAMLNGFGSSRDL